MKINEDEELIFAKFEDRVNVVYSPEINQYLKTGIDENRVLAELISNLKSFYTLLESVRSKAKVKVVSFPKQIQLENLFDLFYSSIDQNQIKEVEEGIDEILKKYELPTEWRLSIKTAIVTHTLLVPPRYSKIRFHFPVDKEIEDKTPKSLSELSSTIPSFMERMRRMNETAYFPAIFFTEHTTINEIKTWLEKNMGWIRKEMSKLPKHSRSKLKSDTLFWGQVVWILLQKASIN